MDKIWEIIIMRLLEWLLKRLDEGNEEDAAKLGKKGGILARNFQKEYRKEV